MHRQFVAFFVFWLVKYIFCVMQVSLERAFFLMFYSFLCLWRSFITIVYVYQTKCEATNEKYVASISKCVCCSNARQSVFSVLNFFLTNLITNISLSIRIFVCIDFVLAIDCVSGCISPLEYFSFDSLFHIFFSDFELFSSTRQKRSFVVWRSNISCCGWIGECAFKWSSTF